MAKRFKYNLLLIAALSFIMACSNSNSLDGCARGVLAVSFYSKTACQPNAFYPEEITDLLVCVFDDNDILTENRRVEGISLSEEYTVRFSDMEEGLYTVLAWSGIFGDDFETEELRNGSTGKEDLLFRLKRTTDNRANSIDGQIVYFGESRTVYIKNDVPASASVNLLETTNRITVSVEGLEDDLSNYLIIIESANGSMNIDGSIAEDEAISYQAIDLSDTDLLSAAFTTLKLETGVETTLRIISLPDYDELFNGSLLGTLLLKNPEINLNCDHDFTILFTAEDQCDCGTYAITAIRINNWLIHSYDTDF